MLARLEGGGVGVLRVGEDESVAQGDDAVGVGGEDRVVGDEDEGCAFGLVEVEEELEDSGAVGGVEVAGGLVGEHDGGAEDEGAGERDALLLAAGELDGVVVEAVAEADGGEEGAGAARFLRSWSRR